MPTSPKKRSRQPDASSTSRKIRELLTAGISVGDVATKLACTPALVYNVRARQGGGGKRRPGRPRATNTAADGLAGILEMIQSADRDRTSLRAILDKIRTLVAEALA